MPETQWSHGDKMLIRLLPQAHAGANSSSSTVEWTSMHYSRWCEHARETNSLCRQDVFDLPVYSIDFDAL